MDERLRELISTALTQNYDVRIAAARVLQAGAVLGITRSNRFPTVNAHDSAFSPVDRIACIDSNFNYALPSCAAVREGYAIPSAAGEYTRLEHALRLGLRYEFQ